MHITADTHVYDLVHEYPFLADYLAGYATAFQRITSPGLLGTVGRTATLGTAADLAGIDTDRLVADVLAEVERRSAEGTSADEEASRDLGVESLREAPRAPTSPLPTLPPGHPVSTYVRENRAAEAIVATVRAGLAALAESPDQERSEQVVEKLSASIERLSVIDTHYTRKENQLFPMLETHGVAGPTQVMWGIHDEIRERLKQARAAASDVDAGALLESRPEALVMLEDMIHKEEHVLFPVALERLSEREWAEMAAGEREIGFAWIEPPAPPAPPFPHAPASTLPAGALELTTGELTLEQLDLMLRTLPVDLTFVDETGRVRYYSEGRRVFPRSPAVIGRAVRDCHPPKSVAVVERIVEELRSGAKDEAEFWIETGGRFVHIRYLALRDASGAFRGVLEVAQDATDVRALEGERRLLDW